MRSGTLVAVGLGASLALGGALALAAQPQPASPDQPAATPGQAQADPQAILQGACTSCHGLDFITEHRKSRDDWDFTVRRMIDKGAEIDPDSAALVIDYLARTYPAEAKPAASPPAP